MNHKTLLILNGPGLGDARVGRGQYDNITLRQIRDECAALCQQLGMGLEFRQTDDQRQMYRWIERESESYGGLIINPVEDAKAGDVDFDNYRSVIDAIAHLNRPVIEVRLHNIFRGGAQPAKPLPGPEGKMGFVCGLGVYGYLLAIKAVAKRLRNSVPA